MNRTKKRLEDGNKARMKLKLNPAYFYKYAKKFSKTNIHLSSLITKDGKVVTDPQVQAEMLMTQYESVYSCPREEFRVKDADDFFKTAWQKEQDRLVTLEQEEQERIVSDCRRCAEEQVHICAGDLLTAGPITTNNQKGG